MTEILVPEGQWWGRVHATHCHYLGEVNVARQRARRELLQGLCHSARHRARLPCAVDSLMRRRADQVLFLRDARRAVQITEHRGAGRLAATCLYYAAILGAVLPCIADKEEKIQSVSGLAASSYLQL